jgi:hypothetical protein
MNTNTASRVRRIAPFLAAGFTAGAGIGFAAGLCELPASPTTPGRCRNLGKPPGSGCR